MKDEEKKLLKRILDEMSNVSKPQMKFFMILMKTIVAAYGKINFRSLKRYSGMAEKTFSRWFNRSFNFSEFNSLAIDKVIGQDNEVVAAFDKSFDGKAGKKTWGKDYLQLTHLPQSKHHQSKKRSTKIHRRILPTTVVWIFI